MLINSEAYAVNKKFIYGHDMILAELGELKKIKLSSGSKVSRLGDSGEADLYVLVVGSKGEGHVKSKLTKAEGSWTIKEAAFIKAEQEINLMSGRDKGYSSK